MIVVGLMCGTSLDGIDAARVDIRRRGGGYAIALEAFQTYPLDAVLRRRLVAAMPPAAVDARTLSALHGAVGEVFGDAARVIAGNARVQLTGSHGITLAHDGDARSTLQIGDPFRIRERIGTTVVSDFRSADTAAGGVGAPLVPYVDALLLADAAADRVALNLGGIANLTVLPAGAGPGALVAFDSGPANLTVDAEMRRRMGVPYDDAGSLAATGTPDPALLERMLDDEFFRRTPPKSTGRERYGAAFARRWAPELDRRPVQDALATLVELSARSIAAAVAAHAPPGATVIASGGGIRNAALMRAIARCLPEHELTTSERFGLDPDAKEAIAFALLAVEALRGRTANVPTVTGARGARVLGSIAPLRLDEVLAELQREELE